MREGSMVGKKVMKTRMDEATATVDHWSNHYKRGSSH